MMRERFRPWPPKGTRRSNASEPPASVSWQRSVREPHCQTKLPAIGRLSLPRSGVPAPSWRTALIVAAVAFPLTACVHSTSPEGLRCPAPSPELMSPPTAAPALPDDDAMDLQGLLNAYLADLERWRAGEARLRALQAWGRNVCGWPAPTEGLTRRIAKK